MNPNDIALLRLAKPIFFNSRVQPIRLAEQDTTPVGESRLAGWGLLKSAPNSKAPEKLQEIDLPILTFKGNCRKIIRISNWIIDWYIIFNFVSECNDSVESFRDSEDDRNPLDERSNVCTGPLTGGKSACNGDSGGPLVQIENNKTVQVALVFWLWKIFELISKDYIKIIFHRLESYLGATILVELKELHPYIQKCHPLSILLRSI